tara:strand:+ start:351 stop:1391 length:1041 start_codon:yes stop_codon:yes gene_type:complete
VTRSQYPTALILGIEGKCLSSDEKQFFRDLNPLGFILFQRNCESPDQITRLVGECRETVGRDSIPILIDQEGGRVQRLSLPHWRNLPSAKCFADLYEISQADASEALYLNSLLMARDLIEIGITINCAPVLDVPQPYAHDIIGDRALGSSPRIISVLASIVCRGLLAGGVLPVIKHMPGHGRACADSHLELPTVDASWEELENSDFIPFYELSNMPWAMTAHVLYSALDDNNPATTSLKIIQEVIRKTFKFDGVLVSDDIGMSALSGNFDERVSASLGAGCDIALHCSGNLKEMVATASGAQSLRDSSMRRLQYGEELRQRTIRDEIDKEFALDRLERLLAKYRML